MWLNCIRQIINACEANFEDSGTQLIPIFGKITLPFVGIYGTVLYVRVIEIFVHFSREKIEIRTDYLKKVMITRME